MYRITGLMIQSDPLIIVPQQKKNNQLRPFQGKSTIYNYESFHYQPTEAVTFGTIVTTTLMVEASVRMDYCSSHPSHPLCAL